MARVTAEVVLRPPAGRSLLRSEPNSSVRPVEDPAVQRVIADASERLRGLGFDVLREGPVSLTVSGDRTLFDRVFQTHIEAGRKNVLGPTVHGAEIPFHTSSDKPRVPRELASVVEDVVLPRPMGFAV
jgi:hypothetical protein